VHFVITTSCAASQFVVHASHNKLELELLTTVLALSQAAQPPLSLQRLTVSCAMPRAHHCCATELSSTGSCELLRWYLHLLLPVVAAVGAAAVPQDTDVYSNQSHCSRYSDALSASNHTFTG
jgi:hypothetical protein